MTHHEDFVGLENLVAKHNEQIKAFVSWAESQRWDMFHSGHYDWWAFPIDRPSSLGFSYTLDEQSTALLRHDEAFLARHKLGCTLVLLSWGYSVETGEFVSDPAEHQAWARWPIRLEKCARSMALLNQRPHFEHCARLARMLQNRGESFEYLGRDLFSDILSYSVLS